MNQQYISTQWKESCFNEILENFGQISRAVSSTTNNQNMEFNLSEENSSPEKLTFEQMINIYEKENSAEEPQQQNFQVKKLNFSDQLSNSTAGDNSFNGSSAASLDNNNNNNMLSNSLSSSLHNLQNNNNQLQQQQKPSLAQDLKSQLNMIRMSCAANPDAPLQPTNDIEFSRSRMVSEKQKAALAKKQAMQQQKQGSKLYQQTNTSHITFNMVNQLFPYLIKMYQSRVSCKCTDAQLYEKAVYMMENNIEASETLVQDAHQCCKRCFELQELVQLKSSGKKNKKTFEQIWAQSKRIQLLSEDFFLHRGATSILSHKQYRNKEGKLALYDSLPKFVDAVRTNSFKKIIG